MKIEMADIMRALEKVRGAPVLTSNQCWDLAQALNDAAITEASKSGFYQIVEDADLKDIEEFLGNGELPTQSFFMRPDAARLANMSMHLVREVQSLRLKLASANQ